MFVCYLLFIIYLYISYYFIVYLIIVIVIVIIIIIIIIIITNLEEKKKKKKKKNPTHFSLSHLPSLLILSIPLFSYPLFFPFPFPSLLFYTSSFMHVFPSNLYPFFIYSFYSRIHCSSLYHFSPLFLFTCFPCIHIHLQHLSSLQVCLVN